MWNDALNVSDHVIVYIFIILLSLEDPGGAPQGPDTFVLTKKKFFFRQWPCWKSAPSLLGRHPLGKSMSLIKFSYYVDMHTEYRHIVFKLKKVYVKNCVHKQSNMCMLSPTGGMKQNFRL